MIQYEGQGRQGPILKALEGGGEPRSGADVLDEVVDLIDRRLPDVSLDDAVRPHLERFRLAARPLPSVLRLERQ